MLQKKRLNCTQNFISNRFRDQMVDKLKGSKQKITNMYFIVGDVVQRNIKLFRA
jgi:hypothetical protein